MIHTVKGFGIVNEAEEAVSLEFLCFLHDPAYVDNLMSGSSAFSKTSLNIRKFTVHILLNPSLKDVEHKLRTEKKGMISCILATHKVPFRVTC